MLPMNDYICKVKCKKCGDTIIAVCNDEKQYGNLLSCECGAVRLGPAAVDYRILGNAEDYEDLSGWADYGVNDAEG
jgi:predicted RNA-binding Zn-ribbon protein involved in translation (DUF1610 family)